LNELEGCRGEGDVVQFCKRTELDESQSRVRVLLSRRVFVDQLQNRNARVIALGYEKDKEA